MAPEALLVFVLACAPQVHPETAWRVIKHESRGNPYVIGINGPYRLTRQPRSRQEAVAVAKLLIEHKVSVDMGLSQINSNNLQWLGLTVEDVFDPCKNIKAMQTVLTQAYERAVRKHGPRQQALVAALSEYNTGSQVKGIANGYVHKVQSVQVPQWVREAIAGHQTTVRSTAIQR